MIKITFFVAIVLLAAFAATFSFAKNIDHVVVLMLENRAFNHMLGFMNRENPEIDGIKPDFFNEWQGIKYHYGANTSYVAPFDPDHSFQHTTYELFSQDYPAHINPAPMSGFVGQAAKSNHPTPDAVMQAFTPDRVPAISTLAREFTLLDKYFSSFPGETVINRVFFNKGDSNGKVNAGTLDVVEGYSGKTNYDVLSENNITWKSYFEDISDLWYMNNLRNLTDIEEHFRFYEDFIKDAAAGTLPQFSWVSPRFYPDFGKPARDQHPAHSVVFGEQIMAEVYSALRNGPKWNRTVLLLCYDEHGGWSDTVSPPDPVPSTGPATDITPPFNFTRLGIRVPAILVSPLAKKGFVEHHPAAGGEYEHCSIFNTLQEIFGFPNQPLSARQAWAASYAHLLSEPAPRTDCPTSVPTPQIPSAIEEAKREMANPPSGLQKEFYDLVEGLHGRSGLGIERFKNAGELGQHVRNEVKAFLSKKKHESDLLRGLKKNN